MRRLLYLENLTLIALLFGFVGGVYLPELMLKLKILGDIFLSLLKMIIVPLVFTSVFIAMLGLGDIAKFRDIGTKTILYYVTTTTLSVLTGLVLVVLLKPGEGNEVFHRAGDTPNVKELTLVDVIWNIIPSNPVRSFTEGNVLQIIFFAVLFGLATLSVSREKMKHVFNFFDGLNDGLINLTRWVVRLTPVGVFALVGFMVADMGTEVFFSLWKYALTVVLGLTLHAFLTLPLLGFIFGRYNPYRYLLKVREAPLLAFSTASSAATLPVSIQVAEEKGGVKKETAGFVLPLGATINMDGTALYESVAAVFIANVYGIELSLPQLGMIFLTATLASIDAAAIPGAGLVMLTLVLSSVGIPLEGIGLIIAIDRFLDMLRTAVNVWGDLNGARIIDRFVR
ncbi:Na+/H+-dicarboxylate symporter [Hydrogenivirga caldilitoris]|uniref:Na+/H+-dicarboxylate symporter n=1 Tax=Hydrogenivirga caldilitoris TaxID=246264 RepID=A0A497XU26_9AQUI|nr:dicarboxylate/amino acid:cation symporter [Hydrogenivirga caldilitoris]RLJ70423.1 Na+/H+-dicarboxylate symporter [Hydrogenivirga caldilitoris]